MSLTMKKNNIYDGMDEDLTEEEKKELIKQDKI